MTTTETLLAFDPLSAAEEFTGLSYQQDEPTSLLGFALALQHNKLKDQHLKELGDTSFCNNVDDYVKITSSLGFQKVLDIPFEGKGYGDEVRNDHFYVYAHTDGLLLCFDTFDETRVNGGTVRYCCEVLSQDFYKHTSSGKLHSESVWVGDHDCREALVYKLSKLREHSNFLPIWPTGHNMFLWLLHYQDTKVVGYDYRAINAERIAMLPEWVKTMINVQGD